MSDEAVAVLLEIRDLVLRPRAADLAQDAEIAGMYDRLAALEAQLGRLGVRVGKIDARDRGRAHEIRELAARVLVLEGAGRERR